MDLLAVLLALSPVIVIFLLLTLRRTAADVAGLIGWVVAVAVAWLYFQTPLAVTLRASLGGILASLPIALVVATSIFQVTVMLETGPSPAWWPSSSGGAGRPGGADHAHQCRVWHAADGSGCGAGVDPAADHARPGLLLLHRHRPAGPWLRRAVHLRAARRSGSRLCEFCRRAGGGGGGYFARFMPVISTCIALGMLWIAGRWKMVRQGLVPALLAGVTAGLVAIGMNAIGLITLTGIAAGWAWSWSCWPTSSSPAGR